MSPGKDYCSPEDSACDSLRRSERITRYSIRKTKATIGKKAYIRAGKKLMRVKSDESSPAGTKQKADDKSDERAAHAFSGESLTPEELHQLLIKFKEDGHFRFKVATASSSRPAASSTKDIRPATKRKKQRDVIIPAAEASKRTNRDDNVEKNRILRNALVPEAITSSNPLPHATGSTLQISTSKSQYVPISRSEYNKSWNGPIICRNLLSSGSFREGNGIDFSWDRDSFPPVASSKPCQFGSTVNPCKQVSKDANPGVSWKSFERENGQLDNRNDANACGFYSNRDKSQTGSNDNSTRTEIGRSNRENMDNTYVNCTKLRSVQTPCNAVWPNFNENGGTAGASLGKQMNSGNSTFVTPTEGPYGKSATIWNVTGPNVPNTFATDNSSMQHPTGLQNTMNYVSPDFGYNENKSSNDLPQRSHGFGGGANSGTGYNNFNAHYWMTWKSLQVFPNAYSNPNDSYVNDAGNCPISPVLPSMFVNESDNFVDQTNCWLQNNVSNRGSFPNAGNETGLSVVANNFANPAPPTTSMTEESTIVTRMNTNDKTTFFFDEFPDSQDRTFCSTVSSIGSYDDDFDYDHCLVIDENSVSTATTPNHESFLDPLATTKAEDRPMYDSTAIFPQYNCRFNNQESMLYNFDTKAELAGSPDCVIIPNSTRT